MSKRILSLYLVWVTAVGAQDMDTIIEKIYQANMAQELVYQSLYPYTYKQDILFQKLDDEGKIEEQSRRKYIVEAISEDQRERVLAMALNYEDGQWQDVTENEKDSEKQGESKKFSLEEMVGPENRHDYIFKSAGIEEYNGYSVYHIMVDVREPLEERFKGDLWVHGEEFVVLKASLKPSDLPAAVDDMTMEFEMSKTSGHWLPARVTLDARISFLFFFSGRIKSDITFYDYIFSTNK